MTLVAVFRLHVMHRTRQVEAFYSGICIWIDSSQWMYMLHLPKLMNMCKCTHKEGDMRSTLIHQVCTEAT
jgi:hypothetical protein